MVFTFRRARVARAVAAAGLTAVIASSLLGCTSNSSSDQGNSDKPTGSLKVLVGSADGSDKAFKQLNEDFQAAYPGVTVDFSSVPNDSVAASKSSRLTAGNLDVTIAQPIKVPSFAKDSQEGDDALAADAGLFLDLSGQKFLQNFTPSVIDSLKYDGKDYTVPTGLSYYTGVYYNKKIFDANGIAVPTTWTEFQAAAAKLQSAGVTPLGVGGKEGWPAGLLMQAVVQSLYPSNDDKVDLATSIYDGKTSLTDDKEVMVLDRVKSLYDIAQKNFTGVSYSTIPSEFAAGNVAMTIDGTWDSTTIDGAVNGSFDFGYFPLPASDNAADNTSLGGKVELTMVAASNAPNKTAALAYLDFFSQPANYTKFVETAGFAPAQPNVQSSSFLQSIAPYTTTFEPAWDRVWYVNSKAGPAAALAFNFLGVAPLGTLSVQDAAAAAETDWKAAG